jgi:hypothetical protein
MPNVEWRRWRSGGLFLLAVILAGVTLTASAENDVPDKAAKAQFTKLSVKPASLGFAKINLASGPASLTKSFILKNSGNETLSVTVGSPANSAFQVISGGGPDSLNAGASETVTVEFAPNSAGSYSDSLAISSDATKGKASVTVKLKGSAKGSSTVASPTPSPSSSPTPTPSNESLFIASPLTDSVLAEPASSNGSVVPTSEIIGANSSLLSPVAIALDADGNIYVANTKGGPSGNGSVTVYAAGSNGNVVPTAVITGPDTGLSGPTGIALDSQGNIYVADPGLCPRKQWG